MDGATLAPILAHALRDDRLVALVGSGASARTIEQNREYRGLPTPQEFAAKARKRHLYIPDRASFAQACDLIVQNEKRSGLEDELLRAFRVNTSFEIPPAHRILSWLPFSCYVTSNFDQFIERSLEREMKPHHVIIDNQDVARLKRSQIPVVKYHGCVSRPATMVASTADYETLNQARALVKEYIKVALAGRTLLVIGHGLNDSDLSSLLNSILRDLGPYAPQIFVVREPGAATTVPYFSFSYDVIHEDLTIFLNRLLHEYRDTPESTHSSFRHEAWVGSAFFAKLRHSFVLPSETQVIDAFLDHLAEEFGARADPQGVAADAANAIEDALSERPNYTALRRTWSALSEDLLSKDSPLEAADAEHVVRSLISERNGRKELFQQAGNTHIRADSRILLYSQSQRVIQALLGVPKATQNHCEIFIAECRPKSPTAYADAIAVSRALADTNYVITICPDVVAETLMGTGQVTQVVMGTHAIYVDEVTSEPYAYVNTCGSLAISLCATTYQIPILVIGELLKVEAVPREMAAGHLYVHQESDLLEGQLGVSELSTQRADVNHLNVGYDLVYVTSTTKVVIPDALESTKV